MHAIPKNVLLFGNVRPLWSIGPDEIFLYKKNNGEPTNLVTETL